MHGINSTVGNTGQYYSTIYHYPADYGGDMGFIAYNTHSPTKYSKEAG